MLVMSAIVGAFTENVIAGSGGCRTASYAVWGLSGAPVAFSLKSESVVKRPALVLPNATVGSQQRILL